MQIQQMTDSMLSDRSWLPGFRRKIFMQNSKSTWYDKREKEKGCQNRLKKRRDDYELKDQNHGVQQRLTSVEAFDVKLERVWKKSNEGGSFPNV